MRCRGSKIELLGSARRRSLLTGNRRVTQLPRNSATKSPAVIEAARLRPPAGVGGSISPPAISLFRRCRRADVSSKSLVYFLPAALRTDKLVAPGRRNRDVAESGLGRQRCRQPRKKGIGALARARSEPVDRDHHRRATDVHVYHLHRHTQRRDRQPLAALRPHPGAHIAVQATTALGDEPHFV
jgi:hypothetical protein